MSDDDDRWRDVLDQVTDALNEAEVRLGPARDALLDGVRDALDALGEGFDLDVEILPSATGEGEDIDVQVMAGGRGEDDPPTPGERPQLRVAESAQDMGDEPADLDEPGDVEDGWSPKRPVFTQVKVLRTPPRGTPTRPRLGEVGWIHLLTDGAADSLWQTVYQGRSPRVYRVGCTRGSIDVTVDSEPVERLRPGQSMDVEGAMIRVTTSESEGAQGGYTPVFLPAAHTEE
jgi:hypothetical protein